MNFMISAGLSLVISQTSGFKRGFKVFLRYSFISNLFYSITIRRIYIQLVTTNSRNNLNYIDKYLMPKFPSIWTESPCSIPFQSKFICFDQTKRFQYNSIYHKDDPFKPAKAIDQTLIPDALLRNFRKQIKDASKSPSKQRNERRSPSKYDPQSLSNSLTITPEAINISKRLYGEKHEALSLSRDRFGNRSTFFEKDERELYKIPQQPKNLYKKISKETIDRSHMTTSNRLELGRPMNFNPGPGSYFSIKNIDNHKSFHLSSTKNAISLKQHVLSIHKSKRSTKIASIFGQKNK